MTVGAPIPAFDAPDPPPGVRVVDDPEELHEYFGDRPDVHAYALADLEEPYWSASRWYRRDDAVVGLVGLPDRLLAAYAVTTRDPSATNELVADIAPALPSGLLMTGPVGLTRRLERVRPIAWHGPHERSLLVDPSPRASDRAAGGRPHREWVVESLGPTDRGRLEALHATDPGAVYFPASMLDDATFVGIRRDGDPALAAASGTHVVSDRHRVAAIGAVLTHPSRRGQGLGRLATAGTIRRIDERWPDEPGATIVLNVSSDNGPARRVYDSLGFRAIHTYEEAELA